MCRVKCEGCDEEGPVGCDCGSIVWDICPECEHEMEAEAEDECSCYQDEINIYCRGCFG